MDHQNMQNKDMNLVLSSDAKPRLKWTPELHQRFIDAINQLGGSDKATPKSLMRVMGIHGLTLYHLKSHLQKYRLGKSQQQQTCDETKQEEVREAQRNPFIGEESQEKQNQMNESSHIAKALQVQMEVQRKLYEQIEVQRHLQLRIEAQGKYLQSVLQKAYETLSEYNGNGLAVELAKEELSQLVSMVDIGCASSLSALTEIEGSILKDSQIRFLRRSNGSLESSLTSSETPRNKVNNQTICEKFENEEWGKRSMVLSLMEMQSGQKNGAIDPCERKRSRNNNTSDESGVEQPSAKRFQSHEFGLSETLDLNRKCLNDLDSDTDILDLNCKGVEKFIAHL